MPLHLLSVRDSKPNKENNRLLSPQVTLLVLSTFKLPLTAN